MDKAHRDSGWVIMFVPNLVHIYLQRVTVVVSPRPGVGFHC